ncbi:MAG: flagellar assembly protein FliW [Candidatus Omnitrophica bacterium]|nr:flagellar assembly protein FliW [Candidatus Omnitrophota bacterium]
MAEVNKETQKVLDLKPENIFTFSDGIPGFEKVKRFVILADPQEAPFGRLSAVDHDLCFFVINPWAVFSEYKPDIDEEDLKKIGFPTQEELLILSIVNVPPGNPKDSTMNLVAPLIINSKKGLGRQIILNNFKEFSSRHKLWKDVEDK